MSSVRNSFGDPWPALSYSDFAATQHLLHMGLQAIGKLKLQEPFQPQWAQAPLWVSARGLTTGPIPYSGGAYEVAADFISHQIGCMTSWGFSETEWQHKPFATTTLSTRGGDFEFWLQRIRGGAQVQVGYQMVHSSH